MRDTVLHHGSATLTWTDKRGLGRPAPGGVLLGIGASPTAVEDAERFFEAHPGCRVMAVNDTIGTMDDPMRHNGRVRRVWPHRLDLAASLHSGLLPSWLEGRERAGLPMPQRVFAPLEDTEVATDRLHTLSFPVASSGLLPVVVGNFVLRAREIWLAGVALAAPISRYLRSLAVMCERGLLDNVRFLTPGPARDLVCLQTGRAA